MSTVHPLPPSTWLALMEAPRAAAEVAALFRAGQHWDALPPGDGHAVITVPGFGAGDGAMAPMRWFLRRLGYDARPWLLGRNFRRQRITAIDDVTEFREQMQEKLAARVADVAAETGRKVSLVGWSLGGAYVNALACREPEHLRCAITLGTPFGDPRATKAWNLLKTLNRSDVPEHEQDFDSWLREANARRKVPTTVIYSPTDGIVAPAIATLKQSRYVENVAVDSSHVGFALNPQVYAVIARSLARSA
ncbi:MAG: alpha/beta fold hydrolase [Gammaproteobacteria bacterium]|nr:MAG: alpha/beta fold hydrolase [Gammaproteobacteria bacterium]